MADTTGMLFWTWCLPQTLMGTLLKLFFQHQDTVLHKSRYRHAEIIYVFSKSFKGMSLGKYIFLTTADEVMLKHEYGHSMQSLILGPFFIPVIGVLSSSLYLISLRNDRVRSNYFRLFPENWADMLGGVKRSYERVKT